MFPAHLAMVQESVETLASASHIAVRCFELGMKTSWKIQLKVLPLRPLFTTVYSLLFKEMGYTNPKGRAEEFYGIIISSGFKVLDALIPLVHECIDGKLTFRQLKEQSRQRYFDLSDQDMAAITRIFNGE